MLQLPKSKYILAHLYILFTSSLGFAILIVDAISGDQSTTIEFLLIVGGVIFSAFFMILNIIKLFSKESLRYTELFNGIFLWLQFFQFLILGLGYKFVLGTQFLLILCYQDGSWGFELFENLWKYEFALGISGEITQFRIAINVIPLFLYWFNVLTKND